MKAELPGMYPGLRGSGPVAALDGSCRLACLALLSIADLAAPWQLVAFLVSCLLVLLGLSGIKARRIAADCLFIFLLAGISALLGWWGKNWQAEPGAWAEGGIYGLRLLGAFLLARLFYASTRISEIRDSTTRIMRRLPFLRSFDLGLAFSLVLSNVPRLFRSWEESLAAAKARGFSRNSGPGTVAKLLGAYLRRLMLDASASPEALGSRGWSRERGLTQSRWKLRDSIVLGIALSFLVICLALGPLSLV